MAVRFDAAADRLLLTSSLFDYNSTYTLMGWVYLVSDLNANSIIFGLSDNTTSNIDSLRTTTDGVTLETRILNGGAGTQVSGSALTVGVWAHVALVRESATSIKVYVNGVLDSTNTRNVTGRTAQTRTEVGALSSANLTRADMRIAYMKAWSAALTIDEIANEMQQVQPLRWSNLFGWWPNRPGSGERAKDYSGNGRNFTESGTLTDEDPPPVMWGARKSARAALTAITYTQSVAGTLTSSGALTKQTGKRVAGTLTSAGALVRSTGKLVAGSLSSAGALLKQTSKRVAGTLSSSGALAAAHTFLKSVAGTLTSSGALTKQTGKRVAGTLTSSGSLARQTGKLVAGTLTSAGALVRSTSKRVAGTLASSGTLAAVRIFLKSVAGTLTSSGALTKQTGKRVAGSLSSAGALVRSTSKLLAGTLTSSGSLAAARTFLKSVAGTLTSSGSLTRQTGKRVAGSLSSAGALLKQTGKRVAGTLTSSGSITKQTSKTVAGSLSSAGALLKQTGKRVAGALTSSGSLTRQTGKRVAGSLSSAGALVRSTSKRVAGTLTSSGALTAGRIYLKTIAGTLSSSGSLATFKFRLHALARHIARVLEQVRSWVVADQRVHTVPAAVRRWVVTDQRMFTVPAVVRIFEVNAMALADVVKAPAAVLDYQLDWSTYLDSDTIASAAWSVPAGITKVAESNTTTTTTVRLSGGTDGARYTCTCHVVLASGQEDERSITVVMKAL